MPILTSLGVVAGGGFQILRLGGMVTLAVSVLMTGSCAVERLASRRSTVAELAMVRGAAAENKRTLDTERRLRSKAEASYQRARKAHTETQRQAAAALSELRAEFRDAPAETEPEEIVECPLHCTVPERLRRIIEGSHE